MAAEVGIDGLPVRIAENAIGETKARLEDMIGLGHICGELLDTIGFDGGMQHGVIADQHSCSVKLLQLRPGGKPDIRRGRTHAESFAN